MSRDADNIIEVKILGRAYKIKCLPNEANELQSSAHYLDEKMRTVRQSGSVMNADRVTVVTALNLCHELLQLKQTHESKTRSIKERLSDLADHIKKSLVTEEEVAV